MVGVGIPIYSAIRRAYGSGANPGAREKKSGFWASGLWLATGLACGFGDKGCYEGVQIYASVDSLANPEFDERRAGSRLLCIHGVSYETPDGEAFTSVTQQLCLVCTKSCMAPCLLDQT